MGKIPRLMLGRYELDKLLDKGTFAKVYHACNMGTGEEVAIKIIDKDLMSKLGGVQQRIMREIDIRCQVHHPHVVRILEVMATSSPLHNHYGQKKIGKQIFL
jgi:5'-AMP-activated protein kinase catalytic alpha subunit